MDLAAQAQFKNRRLILEPGAQGQRPERAELSRVLLLLFCIATVVFLIACGNVANLLLARGASRAVDMTVRLAIGAGRARLVRHLLIESVLLAGMGSVWPESSARGCSLESRRSCGSVGGRRVELSLTMLSFVTALSAFMALMVGLYPAWQSTRRDLAAALKSATTMPAPRATARFRTTLATAQIALAMALLVVAGLFARSLLNMSRVDFSE